MVFDNEIDYKYTEIVYMKAAKTHTISLKASIEHFKWGKFFNIFNAPHKLNNTKTHQFISTSFSGYNFQFTFFLNSKYTLEACCTVQSKLTNEMFSAFIFFIPFIHSTQTKKNTSNTTM